MSRVIIALIQMSASRRPSLNLEKALLKIRQAVRRGAQIVCLQELFKTRYFCQDYQEDHFNLAETVSGETIRALSQIARKEKIVLIAPLFEKRAKGLYSNSAVLIHPDGSVKGVYRKIHLPDDPGFFEKFYFTPGELEDLQVYSTPYGKIGILICWDQWFPEVARLLTLKGAQIIFYPSAIGWLRSEKKEIGKAQLAAWKMVQRSHAVSNGVYVASVNRVGTEGKILFWGSSFVADPLGRMLSSAPVGQEKILIEECDLNLIEKTRRQWPFLRDRRTDVYKGLSKKVILKPSRSHL